MTKSRSNATAPNAKGTLVVGNGTDASTTLAVASTAGYLLTVDSAEATGLKWAAPAGGGKVLQVVQGTLTSNFTATTGTATDTGLTVSITPSASTSKVLVHYHFNTRSYKSANSGTNYGYWGLVRGATDLQGANFGVINFANSTDKYFDGAQSGSYLDSPATTSSTTYKIQMFIGDSTQMTLQSNATGIASIIAMEIVS